MALFAADLDLDLKMLPVPIGMAVVLGMLGLTFWAARGRRVAADERLGELLLRHPLVLRIFAVVIGVGVPVGILVLSIVFPPKDEGEMGAIFGVHALFAALSAPLLLESFRFALVLTPEGLDCRSPWRGRRFVPWPEVESITYSNAGSWFLIQAQDGYRFRLPLVTGRLDRFLERCEEHLRPDQLAGAKEGYRRLGRPIPKLRTGPVDLSKWNERQDPRPRLPRHDDY
jgi:hypothetical protein